MLTLNFCGQEWNFSMSVNLVHERMFSHLLVMMLQEKTFLRAYGELNSHQSCFAKVIVSSLQISNHWTFLKMSRQWKRSISFCSFDGFSACVACEVHVSPPNFYFSKPMMSSGNIKYVSKT